jgi:hypothetical protein
MDPKVTYQIKTTNDEEFIGKFLDQDSVSMRIKTNKNVVITIPQKEILRIYPLESTTAQTGKNWFENPFSFMYYSSPSVFNMKKGELYYQNTYLFINSIYYGITDKIYVGAGIDLLSTALYSSDGKFNPSVFIISKYGGKINNNFQLGVVALITKSQSIVSSHSNTMGTLYGMSTIGSKDNNMTVGLGWSYFGGDYSAPYMTLGSMVRLSKGCSFITDNTLALGYALQLTYGLRFYGKKTAFDIGLINSPEIYRILPIGLPYIDFIFKL